MLTKVIIVQTRIYDGTGYEPEDIVLPVGVEYREVTQEEYSTLYMAIAHWNSKHYGKDQIKLLRIAEQVEIDDILEAYRVEKEEQDKRRTAAEKKRQQTALERKRKQLEKLKKELGET